MAVELEKATGEPYLLRVPELRSRQHGFRVVSPMKNAIAGLLAKDRVVQLIRPLQSKAASILFCHRFADAELGNQGHSPQLLRANLAFLRRNRFNLIPLQELVDTLEAGESPRPGTVVFTVDDGYADFARVAAPIFAEFDCPVTLFLVSGFLDGALWLWWDRVEYVISETARSDISIELDGTLFQARWANHGERRAAASRLAEALKHVRDVRKHELILAVAERLDVSLPERCPERFAPMTWNQVRHCGKKGASFGPHSVTHPILSRVADGAVGAEINLSWARVKQEIESAVPVFCYPNGTSWSFSPREQRTAREAGLRAALTAVERYATQTLYAAGPDAPFAIPRFHYRENPPHFAQIVSGTERVKSLVRSTFACHGRISR